MKFKKGAMRGELTETAVECGANYTWRTRLALLDDNGHWLYTNHWRTNAHKKAARELTAAGWDAID